MPLQETVAAFDIFQGLTPDERTLMLSYAERLHMARGTVVIEESSPDTDLYLLLDGRVSVELGPVRREEARPYGLELALFRRGEVFGEIAFLRGTRRSARVTAIDDIELLRIDGPGLARCLEQDPGLGFRVMGNLARILAGRMETINLKHRDDIRS